MNMYNRNPNCYNAIHQNPYGDIAITGSGKKPTTNGILAKNGDKMAAYQYGSRILGTVVAYNRLSKGKDTKDTDAALKLIFALMLGGAFPIPYLTYVAYDTFIFKKK